MAMKPRGGVWSVFEDFKPMSEWKQENESHNLIIHLPGFSKEQIRVSTQGQNTIRVRGERLVAGSKWSRFLEDFKVPENSELNATRAKLLGETLTITIPKKVVEKDQEASRPKATMAAPPTTTTTITTYNTGGPGTLEPQSKGLEEKHTEASGRADDHVMKKSVEKEEKNPGRGKELDEVIESATKHDGAKGKEKEYTKGKPRVHSGGGANFTMENYRKAVKGLVDLDEERRLMVNMGVAVLVVLALSAYATYKFARKEE